jgi:hypothetical protein
MMVVVTIVGLIAGVSIPAVSAGIDSVRFSTATESVAAFINAAVNRAERRQQAVEVAIAPKSGVLTMYTSDAGPPRELRLPDGVTIEAVLPAAEGQEDVRRLLLVPGGAIPGMGVQIANRRGLRRIVRIDPMTGFPRVESVNKE